MEQPIIKTVYEDSPELFSQMSEMYLKSMVMRWVGEYREEHIKDVIETDDLQTYVVNGLRDYITDVIGDNPDFKLVVVPYLTYGASVTVSLRDKVHATLHFEITANVLQS